MGRILRVGRVLIGSLMIYVLVHGVLQVLVRRVELLLEQLDLPLEALVRGPALLPVLLRALEIGELLLGLLEVAVEHGDLVLERGDLLVLLEQRLLVLLVLGLGLLCARDCVVCLSAEGLKTLCSRSGESITSSIGHANAYTLP